MKINCFSCLKGLDSEKAFGARIRDIEVNGHKSCIIKELSKPLYADVFELENAYLWSIDGSLKRTSVTIWNIKTKERLHTCCFPTTIYPTQGSKLGYLLDELIKLKAQYPPCEIAMEGSFIHHGSKHGGRFMTRNESNKDIQQALGVTRAVLRDFEPHFYAPKTVKKVFAGHGDAEKQRMIQVAENKFGLTNLTDDEADSIGVGITHFVEKYGMDWNCNITTQVN